MTSRVQIAFSPAPRPPLHPPHIFFLGSRTSSSGAAAVSDRRQLEMAVPPRTFLYGSPPRPGRWRSRAPLTAFGSIRRGAPAPRPVRSRPRCRIPTGKARSALRRARDRGRGGRAGHEAGRQAGGGRWRAGSGHWPSRQRAHACTPHVPVLDLPGQVTSAARDKIKIGLVLAV
jgi:hypothetical protein